MITSHMIPDVSFAASRKKGRLRARPFFAMRFYAAFALEASGDSIARR